MDKLEKAKDGQSGTRIPCDMENKEKVDREINHEKWP
jgi:hypothetical protein